MVIGGGAVAVMFGLAGIYKDGVTIAVVGNYDVLIYTLREDEKTAHVIIVELADGLQSDVYFVGGGVWEKDGDVIGNGSRGGNRFIVSSVFLARAP